MTRRPRLAERRCCLVATLETDWQRSTSYWGAWLCRQLNTMSLSLNATHSGTLEQDVLVLHGFMLIYLTYRISRDIILSTDSQIFINTLCVISSEFSRYEFDDCNWNAVNAVLIVFEWASEWWCQAWRIRCEFIIIACTENILKESKWHLYILCCNPVMRACVIYVAWLDVKTASKYFLYADQQTVRNVELSSGAIISACSYLKMLM